MYAAHFALGLVIQFHFLEINSFLITFGVALLNIVFGYLANYKYETISIDENHRLVYHRPFSRSLIGSIFISLFWACFGLQNRTFLPLFFTVFSHFVLDSIFVDSKRTYYYELIFCSICSAEVLRKNYANLQFDTHGLLLMVAIGYVFYLHYRHRPSAYEETMEMIRRCSEERRGSFIFLITVQQWFVPALSLAVVLYVFIHSDDDLFSIFFSNIAEKP